MSKTNEAGAHFLNRGEGSYLERTSRPIYGLLFLLPFIIFYELGVLFIQADVLNQSSVLVDAFVWLQKALGYLGFGSKWAWIAPPFMVIVILLTCQLTSRKRWDFRATDTVGMGIECVFLAVPLIVLGIFLNSSSQGNAGPEFGTGGVKTSFCGCFTEAAAGSAVVQENTSEHGSLLADVVTGIGAGIYEELVFRLILICLLMSLFQNVFKLDYKTSIVFSVLVSAGLFSAHHHVDFLTGQLNDRDRFEVAKFFFRAIAGVYFAILYAVRGFGITAGTHSFYNIMAVLLNSFFFCK